MIRMQDKSPAVERPAVNIMRGEFATTVAGALCGFDTRLSTVAALEAACGDQPIVEVLNTIVRSRRARDVIPLLAAALRCAEPRPAGDPDELAARATVGEAEAFVLALIVALGFSIGGREDAKAAEARDPLDEPSAGADGAPSRSAA